MPKPLLIAIDGPAAVGKSSVGRLLAQRLDYRFIDTGVMYRALTWLALKRGIRPEDEEKLAKLAQSIRIDLGREGEVLVEGQDVSEKTRSPEVEGAVSTVSRYAEVRRAMVDQQRRLAQGEGVVMAGRDIGTVVLPGAELKLFLQASAEERARRRLRELEARGRQIPYEEVLADLKRRDEIDSRRSLSPLRPAPDAILLDTEGLALEKVVDRILDILRQRLCCPYTTLAPTP